MSGRVGLGRHGMTWIALAMIGAAICPVTGQAILGGQPAPTYTWDDTVSLEVEGEPCTGVLVHPDLVLTAAHCVASKAPALVAFGAHRDRPRRSISATCHRNPRWDGRPGGEDLAYCRLVEPATDVPTAPVLSLDRLRDLSGDSRILIVGYGVSGLGTSGERRFAGAPLRSSTPQLRIGGGGVDSCGGDSGGPAFVVLPAEGSAGKRYLLAISSGGGRCGDGGLYAPVAPALSWIEAAARVDLTPELSTSELSDTESSASP